MVENSDPTRFAELLTRSIGEHGATLEQLSGQLAEAGTPLSTATLSYWCSGRSLPMRARSKLAVTHLERLLALSPGTLVSHLPGSLNAKWNPTVGVRYLPSVRVAVEEMGLDLDRHLEAKVLTDHVRVAEDLRTVTQECHQLHWVDSPELDRFTVLLPMPDPQARMEDLVVDHGYKAGAHRLLPEAGLLVLAVLLDPPLLQGDLGQVRYQVVWESRHPVTQMVRRVPIVLEHLSLGVAFEGEARHCWYEHVVGDQPVGEPIDLGSTEMAQRSIHQAPAGVHRIRWES